MSPISANHQKSVLSINEKVANNNRKLQNPKKVNIKIKFHSNALKKTLDKAMRNLGIEKKMNLIKVEQPNLINNHISQKSTNAIRNLQTPNQKSTTDSNSSQNNQNNGTKTPKPNQTTQNTVSSTPKSTPDTQNKTSSTKTDCSKINFASKNIPEECKKQLENKMKSDSDASNSTHSNTL